MKETSKIAVGLIGILLTFMLFVYGTSSQAVASKTNEQPTSVPVVLNGGVQEIRMSVEGYSYVPDSFTVQAGKPVRWIIDATRASNCASSIVFNEFNIRQRLQKGENVIEFTPTQKGTFQFSCSMGMVKGTMTFV